MALLNTYDLVAGGVTGAIIVLTVAPLVRHGAALFLLWPALYATYTLFKVTPGLRRHCAGIADEISSWLLKYYQPEARVSLPILRQAGQGATDARQRAATPLSYGLAIVLVIAALVFACAVRREDTILGLSSENESALWLLFALPILRLARYGSLLAISALTGMATLCIGLIWYLGGQPFSLTSARLLLIQCLWLILICLLPTVLARYLAEVRGALEAAVDVVGDIAKLPRSTELDFLNSATEIIRNQLGYPEVNVLLPSISADGTKRVLRLAGAATAHGRTLIEKGLEISLDAERGVTVAAARRREIVVVNDVRLDRKLDNLYYDDPAFASTLSEMACPILLGERLLGVLDIESDQAYAFSEDDYAIMRAVVTHLAVALDDRQNIRRAEGLYQMSRNCTNYLFTQKALQPMLRAIAQTALSVHSASSIVLYAWDPIRQIILDPVTAGELAAPPASAAEITSGGNTSLVYKVMRMERETMEVASEGALPNVWVSTSDKTRSYAERAKVRMAVALPLRSGGSVNLGSRTLGALFINYRQPRVLGPDDLRWYEAFGDIASLALQNIWLHQQIADDERDNIWQEIHDGMVQDAWIMRDALSDVAEACHRYGVLTQDEREDLERALWCSTSLHRQVNYLVDIWNESRRHEVARHIHAEHGDYTECGFFNELREYAIIVTHALETACECMCAGDDAAIPSDVQHAAHMIIREAVRNATRHGQATRIAIEARVSEETLCLTINDNGLGFNAARVRVPRGLKSITRRAEACGGSAFVASRPNVGTEVKVTMPINRSAHAAPESTVAPPAAISIVSWPSQ